MPRGDGTGPVGMGAMTGRAAGYCAGTAMSGYANRCGSGRGRAVIGRGIGRRLDYSNMRSNKNTNSILQEEIEELRSELDSVKKRLSEVGGE